jgi:hypothetical protein
MTPLIFLKIAYEHPSGIPQPWEIMVLKAEVWHGAHTQVLEGNEVVEMSGGLSQGLAASDVQSEVLLSTYSLSKQLLYLSWNNEKKIGSWAQDPSPAAALVDPGQWSVHFQPLEGSWVLKGLSSRKMRLA